MMDIRSEPTRSCHTDAITLMAETDCKFLSAECEKPTTNNQNVVISADDNNETTITTQASSHGINETLQIQQKQTNAMAAATNDGSEIMSKEENKTNAAADTNNLNETKVTNDVAEEENTESLDMEEEEEQVEEQEDEDSSTDSDYSDMSDMSEESGREWKPISRPLNWVQHQIDAGANPRELLSQMMPQGSRHIAAGLNDMTLWRILVNMLSEPPRRQKLRNINTFADVVQLVRESKNILVLTGAGVSVSCGIPDFRSSDGIYSRLAKDYPDLPDPQAMFDINYFSRDPRPFFKFAREIYPGQFKPSPCHRFIKLLETKQKLLRNYTQNIDTLEQVAGISNVIECHGSFSTASCTKCKFQVTAEDIRQDIFTQRIPVCPHCQPNVHQSVDASEPVSEHELRMLVQNGIMKPDIVFFGEGLPEKFHTVMASDKDQCDLLIVIGSSLKVRPVALIPSSIPAHVPQILINREQLHHLEFDVELLGDSDIIINQLCHNLGEDWQDICFDEKVLREVNELMPAEAKTEFELEDAYMANRKLEEDEDEESENQFRQETDTQSVKSNNSMEFSARAAAAGFSDSGFESSTASSAAVNKLVAPGAASPETDSEVAAANDLLDLQPDNKIVSNQILTPESLDAANMDTIDFLHPTYTAFNATTNASSYRHLSIDSSKDSGIQCSEALEQQCASSSRENNLMTPPAVYGDSGGGGGGGGGGDGDDGLLPTDLLQNKLPASINCTTPTPKTFHTAQTDTAQAKAVTQAHAAPTAGYAHKSQQQLPQRKRLSAAERLHEGTYYCRESSCSYVFPGAQVSFLSDSEDDAEEEEEESENENEPPEYEDINEEEQEEEEDEAQQEEQDAHTTANISPLLTPSVEAEMVSEITTSSYCGYTNAAAVSPLTITALPTKRQHGQIMQESQEQQRSSEPTLAFAGMGFDSYSDVSSPPPGKKRCDIWPPSATPGAAASEALERLQELL